MPRLAPGEKMREGMDLEELAGELVWTQKGIATYMGMGLRCWRERHFQEMARLGVILRKPRKYGGQIYYGWKDDIRRYSRAYMRKFGKL